ncbi:MAG: acetyl-CoA C-acyltransferase [Cyclobacteriaceae bacterium]
MKEVFIVSACRTPIGSFGGSLSSVPATSLGATAAQAALRRINLDGKLVQEVYMGNVISSGLGQAPATQVAIGAGMGNEIPCTLVNKVCASGMKAIMLGAQSAMLGHSEIILAGGMENMSSIPYYLPKARYGYRYGHGQILDGLTFDALTDAYNNCAMGVCADHTAREMSISRNEQDDYAIGSYKKAAESWATGKFKEEVIPVEITGKKGEVIQITEDEEYKNVNFEKIPGLKPVFSKDGTVTAANASTINDGAAAVVLMSGEKVRELNVKPLARILGFADAAHDPMWFTTAPSLAIPKALKMSGLKEDQIGCYEINEAFSAVAIANIIKLNLDPSKVNINGGAVALGHPLGASGARIVVTLLNVLRQQSQKYGVAGICNGGGGASAIVVENLQN